MTAIKLYEYTPTRSSKCRWALLEAGLDYESIGTDHTIIGSEEVTRIHPLGKVPAAEFDGQPLFESNAIVAAVADQVPEQNLIPTPGTPERAIHDQWAFFAALELEAPAFTAFSNAVDFIMPEEKRVPQIIAQSQGLFSRAACAVEDAVGESDYILGDSFTVTDIIVSHAANTGKLVGFLDEGFPNLNAYIDRMFEREHCQLYRPQ